MCFRSLLWAGVALSVLPLAARGQVTLVKDIHAGPYSSFPVATVAMGSSVFFQADNGGAGTELWKSDGTAVGTTLVKDINATGGSNPVELLAAGNTLYFQANDGINGAELWKSDGTAAGTVLVKDINPVAGASSAPAGFRCANGVVYFTASTGAQGLELWKTDGTAAGTALVKDINPGPGDASPQYLTAVGPALYFTADDGTSGAELWKTDGTEAGTVRVKDINSGAAGSGPAGNLATASFGVRGSAVYFSATDGIHGFELWTSDGTADGTVLVKDLFRDGSSSNPAAFITAGDAVYFQADDSVHGVELWRTDGTAAGTVLVKDVAAGPGSSQPQSLIAWNGLLFFAAGTPWSGAELWKTDGTEAGTVLVKDIWRGRLGSNPQAFTEVNGALYFQAADADAGVELWKTDGTEAGTTLVQDACKGSEDFLPMSFTALGRALLFTARTTSGGYELYRAGRLATTLPVAVRDFAARRETAGNRLSWQAAGEEAGTRYTVQRSPDGADFEPVGTVEGSGKTDYGFWDAAVSGTVFYRLLISDAAGSEHYSAVVAVRRDGGAPANPLTVAPQPATDFLIITNTDRSLNGSPAVVLNWQGQRVAQVAVADALQLDVSNWPAGWYVLQLASGEGLRICKE